MLSFDPQFPGRTWGVHSDPFTTHHPHPHPHTHHPADPNQHTQSPIVTGTSVIAIKYKHGVMLAADTLASYGNLSRFKDVRRLHVTGQSTIVGSSGDMSDFQYVEQRLDSWVRESHVTFDSIPLSPSQIFSRLSNLLYARRNKFDPLWINSLVGGIDPSTKEPFLAGVDLIGVTYSASSLATGFGAHIALPILRKAVDDRAVPEGGDAEKPWETLEEEEARQLLSTVMRVLFYRDCRASARFTIATVTSAGAKVEEPISILPETEWGFAEGIRGYGGQTQ